MGVTIKDIARIAGVSHSTVSRSLHGSPRISRETRQRIVAIAKEYNYTPNLTAQSLKLQRSFTIGIFFTSIMEGTTSNFFHQALKGCARALAPSPYNLVVKGIEEYHTNYTSVNRNHFDGIVVVSQSKDEDSFIEHLQAVEIPHIVINRKVKQGGNLLYNEEQGAYLATRHLIDLGHHRIGFIRGKASFANAHQRELGFRRAMDEAAIPLDETLMVQGDFSMQSGYNGVYELAKWLKKEGKSWPTAIFASCDEMAIGAMQALREQGIAVPQECSIIGFDNTPICEFTSPKLSSVERPVDRMLCQATELIIDLINSPHGESGNMGTQYLDCRVIERDSTKSI